MRLFPVISCVCALAGVPAAQNLLHEWRGPEPDIGFGYSVAGAGDVDQDGVEDWIVGAPWFRFPRGFVQVVSGRTGTTLYRFKGSSLRTMLGYSVGGGADVDGDGVPDFAYGGVSVGGYSAGFVIVRSGADGSVLHEITGMFVSFMPGFDVAVVDDLNGDGHAEFVASDPFIDIVRVYSGLTGGTLYEVRGTAGVSDELGWSVDGADIDGDGRAEVVIGAPGSAFGSLPGTVEVHTGVLPRQLLRRFTGFQPASRFGEAVAIAGDVNGDGTLDIVIGAPDESGQRGRAYVFSNEDSGRLLLTLEGGAGADRFGASVDGVGDLDGDGRDDVVVGAPLNDDLALDGGKITVFSGDDGSILWTALGDAPGGRLGQSVATANLTHGGQRGDVLVGAPHRIWTTSSTEPGYARLHSLESEPGVYCTAKLNSKECVPHASVSGVASLTASDLCIRAGQALNGQNAFLFWGLAPLSAPFKGGVQCVQTLGRRPAGPTGGNPPPDDCSGTLADDWSSADLGALGLAAGQTVYAQFWYADPAASFGVGLTDAVQFTVRP